MKDQPINSTQNRELKHHLWTIENTKKGYHIVKPTTKGLVLGGGGAKGIAYGGMIEAMYERGFMQNITHISGASAGAITSSLLAIGLNNNEMALLINELNLVKLLDNKGTLRAQGEHLRNVLELIYFLQFKKLLEHVENKSSQKYGWLEYKIEQHKKKLESINLTIDTIEDVINFSKDSKKLELLRNAFRPNPEIRKAVEDSPRVCFSDLKNLILEDSFRICFSDLKNLREILHVEKQHLIKNLSVVTTNSSENKLETHNENTEDANESIALKVQQSAAHPFLFTPGKNKHGHAIADGGFWDNMPADSLVKEGLHVEEILCVKLTDEKNLKKQHLRVNAHKQEKVGLKGAILDKLYTGLFGAPLQRGRTATNNREKVFYHNSNMLYLSSGTIKTTSMDPTNNQKDIARSNGVKQTNDLLDERENIYFDHLLLAMLFQGKTELNRTLIQESEHSNIEIKVTEQGRMASYVKQIFFLQDELVNELNQEIKSADVLGNFTKIMDLLGKEGAGLNQEQQDKALAICIKQVDYSSANKLEKYLNIQIQKTQDKYKKSLFTHFLELLWKPIAWIISSDNALKKPEETPSLINEGESIITPFRQLLSFFPDHRNAVPNKDTNIIRNNNIEM
ncbi:MAG: patatin-like phospholipase family protein [Legionella longbeachae]|nr:patatin-like phospholipase family protein [Legionella longbeachae]